MLDHPALVLDRRARKRYFTNFGVLTFCVYLDETGPEQGPLTAVAGTHRTGLLVRGRELGHVHMEPYPARLPPRWDQVGYRSIFSAQAPPSHPAFVDQARARPAP